VISNEQRTTPKDQNPKPKEMKAALIIVGLLLAAIGGVIAYRALYLEPASAVVITNTEVREVPNTMRILGGAALLVGGATIAFLAARRKR